MDDIKKSQDKIRSDDMINYDDSTLRYVQKPVGKALYRGRPRKSDEDKGKPNDRIKCNLCGKEFTRSNRSHHNNTQVHLLYKKVNEKMSKLVLID